MRLIRSNMAPLPIVKPPELLEQKLSQLVADLSQNPDQPDLEETIEGAMLGTYGVSAEEENALHRWFEARAEDQLTNGDIDLTSEN